LRSSRSTLLRVLANTAAILGLLVGPLGSAGAQVPGRMRTGPEPPMPASLHLPEVKPSVQFTDVAKNVVTAYISNNNYTGRKYFPQPMCGGIALIDYDGDGHLDIFFTNGATLPGYKRPDPSFYNCLLRGHGDGTFEDVTRQAHLEGANLDFSFGVAASDIDNDGDPDLFIANAGPNTLYRNNGDGTFTDITAGSGLDKKPRDLLSVCAAFFDYDGDGLLDLVVSHYTYWNPSIDQVCNTALGPVYCAPPVYKSVAHSLYHNLGNGKFEDVSEPSGFAAASSGKGMGIAIADFDDNGWMDVFIANDTEPNFLYMNQGDGTFREDSWAWGVAFDDQGTVVSGMGADTADYNNDGRPDIFYNNLQTQIWALFLNEGRQFRYVSTTSGIALLSRRFSGWSNAFIDYDNDGWKDIYSANGDVDYLGENSQQHDTMFHNVEARGFVDVSQGLGQDFLKMGYQRGSAVGDLNDDGFPDLVVTSLNAKPRILLNSGGNGNHWLWLQLVGGKSNRDAIGAKVKVTTGSGRTIYNHESLSVGFMSSSDQRLQFGLGKDDSIRSVEIRWPSGKLQVLPNVKVDQHLRVEEPQ
jgi:hypothetical protein